MKRHSVDTHAATECLSVISSVGLHFCLGGKQGEYLSGLMVRGQQDFSALGVVQSPVAMVYAGGIEDNVYYSAIFGQVFFYFLVQLDIALPVIP